MENESLLRDYLEKELAIAPAPSFSFDELKEKLAAHINGLINHDFNQLVGLLYRIDINETKLRQVLNESPGEDAGKIIAELVIERQMQKIQSRRQFGREDGDISEEEKW